jgi:tetratricopeptide (TPR) repeat protein
MMPMVTFVAAFGATKRGDLDAATQLAQRGLALSDKRDPIRRYGLFALGDIALFEGRLDESGRYYAEAARMAEEVGDRYTHAYSSVNLAFPLAYQGESDRALAAAHRGRSVAAASGSPHLVAWADYALSEVLADAEPEQAMAALSAALVMARTSGSRFIESVALVSAASLRARHGDPGEALDLFAAAVQQWQRTGNWTQQWTTLRNVIDLFVRLAADEPAAVLYAAMRSSPSAAPLFGSDAARLAVTDATLRARVPERVHRYCSARGTDMADEEAVSYAISEINRLRAVTSRPRRRAEAGAEAGESEVRVARQESPGR